MPRTLPTSIVIRSDLKSKLRKVADARKWKLATCMVHGLTEWVEFQLAQMKKQK